LRVAIISLHTSPIAPLGGKKTGGMNVYVREISRFLGRTGLHVDIFTREDTPANVGKQVNIDENTRLIYLPAGPPQYLDTGAIYPYLTTFQDAMFQFITQNHLCYDILFSHYWLSGWVALQLKDKFQIPIVQMFHTLGRMKDRIAEEEQLEHQAIIPLKERNIRVAVESKIMQHADILLAATPAERIQLLWLYRADRRKIHIIPPGVDTEHFSPKNRQKARQIVGIPHDKKLLLFVGRIEPLKGIHTLFDAFVLLKQNYPADAEKIILHVVGGDVQEEAIEQLKQQSHSLNLQDIIQFVGAQPHDKLPNYYNAAEALIMPSDYESFGMVALEAMACGTPVIASQVGGLAFLIQDELTGRHVPVRDPIALANAIHTLLNAPEQREKLGQQARNVALNYAWPIITQKLIAIFKTLTNTPLLCCKD